MLPGVDEIDAVLRPGAIVPVFQPIVRISDGRVIGYEALARFPEFSPERSPHDWFVLADSYGKRIDLEVACWKAIAAQGPPPDDALLFVNTSPLALVDHRLEEVRAELPERLVVELTEQDAVSDYELLRTRLQSWSNDGVRLAIDDTGAGYSSLQHVLQLAPDFLKLDRSLIAGVDRERSRRVLVRSLVAFGREVGATVIAECVERREELEVLREAGVSLAQGWLLAKPGPPWPHATVPSIPITINVPTPTVRALDEEDRFRRALSNARTQPDAAVAVCEHLHRFGEMMPSVYLLRDGLLRCLAQCGYWQIMDGLERGAGVLSQVLDGQRILIEDVPNDDEFLEAAPGVVAELAVPLWVDGRVVGGLNVESLSPLTAVAEAEVDRCAALLSGRLAEIGVGVPDSPLARLARSSKQLAGLSDLDQVRAAVVRLACDISGMESALLVQRDEHGLLDTVATAGPLAEAFRAIPSADLERLAAMVDRVSSCYTAGDLTGRAVAGTETLRAAGAIEVVVLPLISLGRRSGILTVAHGSGMRLSTDEIEPLELLAAEAARALDLAATVAAWRVRATPRPVDGTREPLGLPRGAARRAAAVRGGDHGHRSFQGGQRQRRSPGWGPRAPRGRRRAAGGAARGPQPVPDRRRRVRGDPARCRASSSGGDRTPAVPLGSAHPDPARCIDVDRHHRRRGGRVATRLRRPRRPPSVRRQARRPRPDQRRLTTISREGAMATGDREAASRFGRIHAAFVAGDLAALQREVGEAEGFPNVVAHAAVGELLIYAIYHSPISMIRELLDAGADPNWPAHDGFPSLIAALSCAQAAPGATPRHDVHDIVALLLDRGADVGQRGHNDYTPLHWAAGDGDLRMVDLLLAHGADPDQITRIDDMETALEVAAIAGHTAVVERLRPLTRRLVWDDAVRSGDVRALARLVRSGHDVDARDGYGQTALMRCAHAGHSQAVAWLIEHGADLDHTSKFGLSATMLAIVAGHPPIARRLISAGAELSTVASGAPGFAGKTARDLADERGDRRLVAFIDRHAER